MGKAGCTKNNLATGNVQSFRMKWRNKEFGIVQKKVIKQTKKKHGRRIGNGKDERFGLQQRVTLVTDKYLDEFCQV